jgi:hypothetical protein
MGVVMLAQQPTATMIDWVFAPDWLSVEQASFLSGHDLPTMLGIIDVDGVDLDGDGRIEKESLWQFLEAEALVLHWDD